MKIPGCDLRQSTVPEYISLYIFRSQVIGVPVAAAVLVVAFIMDALVIEVRVCRWRQDVDTSNAIDDRDLTPKT